MAESLRIKLSPLLLSIPFLLVITAGTSCVTTTSTEAGGKLPPRTYVYGQPIVFNCCIHAVNALGWQLRSSDVGTGIVVATTPVSFATGGDYVTIMVKDEGQQQSTVYVESSSKQAIDWGKNASNLRKFFAKLDHLVTMQNSAPATKPLARNI